MKSNDTIHNLLSSIQHLYSRISNALLQQRLQKPPNHHGSPTSHADLMHHLSDYLDKLEASHTVNDEHDGVRTTYFTNTTVAHHDTNATHPQVPVDELSSHFRSSLAATSHPSIGDKLKTSVIDNIHAAIRHAREGHRKRAQLHFDIANTALSELESFLQAEDYRQFVGEIAQMVSQIQAHSEMHPATSANADLENMTPRGQA